MSALSHRRAVVALVATGALLLAAFAVASQAEASTLYACVKKSGTARVFTKKPKCKKGESKISWNAEGPAGKNGANGASGTNGTNGTSGTNGTNGAVAGYVVVQSGEVSFTQLESKESNALVMSKSLPAGSYIVNGNVEVIAAQVGTNEEGGGPLTTFVQMSCTLKDTPTSGSSVSYTNSWSGVTSNPIIFFAAGLGSVPLDLAVTTTTSSVLTVTCTNVHNDGDNTSPSAFTEGAQDGVITAVQTTSNS